MPPASFTPLTSAEFIIDRMIILSCFRMFSVFFWHKYLFRVLKIIAMMVVAQQVLNMKMTGKTPARSQEIFYTAVVFTIITGTSSLTQDWSTPTSHSLTPWDRNALSGSTSTMPRHSVQLLSSTLCWPMSSLNGPGSIFSSTGWWPFSSCPPSHASTGSGSPSRNELDFSRRLTIWSEAGRGRRVRKKGGQG